MASRSGGRAGRLFRAKSIVVNGSPRAAKNTPTGGAPFRRMGSRVRSARPRHLIEPEHVIERDLARPEGQDRQLHRSPGQMKVLPSVRGGQFDESRSCQSGPARRTAYPGPERAIPGSRLRRSPTHGPSAQARDIDIRRLVLLRHDDSRYGCFGRIVWQHGQRMRVRASTTVICRRMVAIEFSICRSGRIGGASGFGTQG
jgi:hypothetical protein